VARWLQSRFGKAHNPKVAGSNPAGATMQRQQNSASATQPAMSQRGTRSARNEIAHFNSASSIASRWGHQVNFLGICPANFNPAVSVKPLRFSPRRTRPQLPSARSAWVACTAWWSGYPCAEDAPARSADCHASAPAAPCHSHGETRADADAVHRWRDDHATSGLVRIGSG
jgi:hypothetical protein